ncbi:MAG: hypothetical protein ACK56I_22430, partial [bacterium]
QSHQHHGSGLQPLGHQCGHRSRGAALLPVAIPDHPHRGSGCRRQARLLLRLVGHRQHRHRARYRPRRSGCGRCQC